MFNRIRLSLTLWYVGILLLIIVVVAVITYVMLERALGDEVDDSLRASALGVSAQLERATGSVLPTPVTASDDRDNDDADEGGEHDDDDGEEEGDEDDELRFFAPSSGDTFYLVLSTGGELLLNPGNVSLEGIPDAGSVAQAVAEGENWSTVHNGAGEYRLYSLLVKGEHDSEAVLQVGRSLDEHERQLNGVLFGLAFAGGSGLFLAAVGGMVVAGRALRPVRAAFDKQRAFVSDASHELRTPLTVIRGNAEMMALGRDSNLTDDDRQFLQGIVGQATYMEQLVSDLSRLARFEEGGFQLRQERVAIAALLELAATTARSLASGKRLNIAVTSLALEIQGDPVRLQEVLTALVENAVRYTPDGGTVTIGAKTSGEDVEITVSDTGPGIAREHHSRIFDRFFRTDEARSRDRGGTGLGLSIARAITEAHGGSLTVSSEPGRGAQFTVTLPRGQV